MTLPIELRSVPGFSGLFLDFTEGKEFFRQRFPFNEILFKPDSAELQRRATEFQDRGEIIKAIMTTSEGIELSPAQNRNIELIKERSTLTVITGQQVGFLISPLYILLKIYSCINLASRLNSVHSTVRFVPIFWIEDNDHDNLEASQAAIFNESYGVERITCCPDCTKTDRRSVSQRRFDESITDIIKYVEQALPQAQFKQETSELLEKIYKPGRNWHEAFIELLQTYLAGTGILFVRSSVLREQGLYAGLAERELEALGGSNDVINRTNPVIESHHYHIQAKTSEVNLFMHLDGGRHKIRKNGGDDTFTVAGRTYTQRDLLNIARSEPGAYSPNVLLRPVFQEMIFPNVAYIGGPSEIGYATQLLDVYNHFGVPMPAFIGRHSATIIDRRTSRFLDKENLRPEYFLRRLADLEPELRHKLLDNNIQEVLTSSRESIINAFSTIKEAVSAIDTNLIASTESAAQKTLNQMEILEKKIFSAQKKHFDYLYGKFRQASALIYPDGALQERIISPISFIIECGAEKFMDALDAITRQENNRHYFVEM